MNNLNFTGRLGDDAEMRFTASGTPQLKFSVAMDAGYGDRKQTVWLGCSIWGKRAEALEAYMKKGQEVAAHGELSTFTADSGKTYLNVRVNDLTLVGKRSQERAQAPSGDSGGYRDAKQGFRDKPAPASPDDDMPPF